MKTANRFEKDLLTKFIASARDTIPGIKMRYVEKYQYDDDIYLRVGLELPSEIDADSPDIEKVQKIASSFPLHPKYQVSIAFTVPSDPDHELKLDFIFGEYLSRGSWTKRSASQQIFANLFTKTWVMKGVWQMPAVGLASMAFGFFLFVWAAKPWQLLTHTVGATERAMNARYFPVADLMRDAPAQKDLTAKGKEFSQALAAYLKAMEGNSQIKDKFTNEHQDEAHAHVRLLNELIEADPFINIAPK